MIKGIQGFNESQAITGEAISIPPGKYICRIIDIVQTLSKNGYPMLEFYFDINEGPFKDFYSKKFERDKRNNANAKYQGVYRQLMQGGALPYYKGVIEGILASNKGLGAIDFSKDWDENLLKGKLFGLLIGRKEIMTNSGNKMFISEPKAIRNIHELEYCKVPEDELLPTSKINNMVESIVPDENDLPF